MVGDPSDLAGDSGPPTKLVRNAELPGNRPANKLAGCSGAVVTINKKPVWSKWCRAGLDVAAAQACSPRRSRSFVTSCVTGSPDSHSLRARVLESTRCSMGAIPVNYYQGRDQHRGSPGALGTNRQGAHAIAAR